MTTEHLNYVGGEWVESESGDTFEVYNPANTDEVVGEFQASTEADAVEAIGAANEAEDEWADTPGPARGAILREADANMARVPDGVSDEEAVYVTDMMSTGFRAAERANIPVGGTVAVFAQGPVGLMATKGAALCGAGQIIAVENVPKRQELAETYGADDIVDYTEQDVVDTIMELTDGEGVDAAIEALGANATFENCVRVTKPGGVISNVGYHGDGEYVQIPRDDWGVGMAEKDIVTSLCPGGRLRLQRLLRLLDTDRVDPTRMTTHEFAFEDIDDGFHPMETKEDGIIKPLIDFE